MSSVAALASSPSPLLAFFMHDLRAGGAERNIVRLVNGVAAKGIRIDLILISKSGVYLRNWIQGSTSWNWRSLARRQLQSAWLAISMRIGQQR